MTRQVEARTLSGLDIGATVEAAGLTFVIADVWHSRTRTTLWRSRDRYEWFAPTDLVTVTGRGES